MSAVPVSNDIRVILVGRTGLDGALRHDPQLELIRVRTALEAIGELSDPIDEQSPRRAVVVVGPDADPSASPTMEPVPGADAAVEFVRGLRLVDPDVVVLRSQGVGAPARAGAYDGVIRSDDAEDAIRASIRERSTVIRETKPATAAPVRMTPMSSPIQLEPGNDEPLCRAVLSGGDVVNVATTMLQRRTGDRTVRFVSKDREAEVSAREATAPVMCDGRVFGVVAASRTEAAALAPYAAWLGCWLRLSEQHGQLRDAAFTDALTGAWNRRYFDTFLATAIEQARAGRHNLTVLYFDVDDFKTYNDRYGHSAGDEILVETVRLLRDQVRPTDRVCRVGGDEFAVIFHEPEGPRVPGSNHPRDVQAIAHRFQAQICKHRFPKLGSEAPGALTISGGLATFPWDGATVEMLLASADARALESKRRGKNVITVGPSSEPC